MSRLTRSAAFLWITFFTLHTAAGVVALARFGPADAEMLLDNAPILAALLLFARRIGRGSTSHGVASAIAWIIGPPLIDACLWGPLAAALTTLTRSAASMSLF